ncbi:MAG: DUF6261 family protein, partial [Dysgonamonadaceae bacterium]|nr:DUF6261 family protein [Dysgonamonadaceae bacterium]
IVKARLEHYRNEAHFQMMSLFQKRLAADPAVVNIVANLMGAFNTEVELESKLVDAVLSSPYTEQLANTDKRLDRAIVGLSATIEADLHHYNPLMVEAARKIALRLKAFRGEIENKPYEEESAAVKILLNDLQTTYSAEVGTLSLSGWVFEISDAQTTFEELFLKRDDEWASRPTEKLPDVRKRVNVIYRNMVELIDAYGALNGYSVTGEFVGKVNSDITYFNEHIHGHAKKEIDKATVNDIPPQVYADEPVVPMPEVFYDDKKLVFTRDYELSYRDNDGPGTALVTIHGKGSYKGRKQVSFNIVKD